MSLQYLDRQEVEVVEAEPDGGCIVLVHVPLDYADAVERDFPQQYGDFLRYRQDMTVGMSMLHFYVSLWHPRVAQYRYLQKLRHILDEKKIDGLRIKVSFAEGFRVSP